MQLKSKINVYLACTGVGTINRGIETFARECFDGLHGKEGLNIKLFKGAGEETPDEYRLWNLPRNGKLAPFLGKFIRRNGYVVEQLSSFLPFVQQIIKGKPDIIFYSDSNLGFQLYRWRKLIGVPYKLIFSNGGPCHPPFSRTDHVQQVAPFYRDMAIQAGEPDYKHSLVPYGINVPSGKPLYEPEAKLQIRQKLGLPLDRPIVLSVGWISSQHKRMDYVVNEVAALPEPRPYLVMLGYMDEENTPLILRLAEQKLGKPNFAARSVPYAEVEEYYQAVNIFTLGSLQEGFGRVYLEALMHGLPCIVHDHPVMRYVLKEQGIFADFSQSGSLTQALADLLGTSSSPDYAITRREYVRKDFSWDSLAPAYLKMFKDSLKG